MTTSYLHPLAAVAPQKTLKAECPEAFVAMAKASVLSEMLSGVTAMATDVRTRSDARDFYARMRFMVEDLGDILDSVIDTKD
jgi:hypothetical protein